jgi:hypothetical protein
MIATMTTHTDRTFGYCNQLMDRCPEHGPNVMGGIRYRRDFTQGIHSSVTSSPRGPVLATDRFPPVGRIQPVSHRLLYAPRNRGSVRLKARRRDWWLSCV